MKPGAPERSRIVLVVVFHGLKTALGRVLMLLVWFTLPGANTEDTKNVEDFLANLGAATVTDEDGWGHHVHGSDLQGSRQTVHRFCIRRHRTP